MRKSNSRYQSSLLVKRIIVPFVLIMLLSDCDDDFPIKPGISENVAFLSLTHNSSGSTLQANGVNILDFTINKFDSNKQPLGELDFFESKNVRIKVSNGEVLTYPYHFQTSKSGYYTFQIENLADKHLIGGKTEINAREPYDFETTTMPVIFHFVTNSTVTEDEKIELQKKLLARLEEVNAMFANKLGSVDPNASSMFVQFTPAQTDPQGNPLTLEGLNVVYASQSDYEKIKNSDINDFIWNGNFWIPRKYINVWILNVESVYSWAYFPSLSPSISDFPSSLYGIVFNKNHIDISWVLAHEFGHMFHLYHVFDTNGYCEDADDCKDTWSYQRKHDEFETKWQYVKKTNCNEVFTSNNLMDYEPSQFNTFSYEQTQRTRSTLFNCPFLPTPANLNGRIYSAGYSTLRMKHVDDRPHRIY